MPKLSPRDAAKTYLVSRATLMRALSDGKISAEKTDAGHWQIDTAELARLYKPRPSSRTRPDHEPDQVSRRDTPPENHHSPTLAPADPDIAARLALAEAALKAEREKTALLQRHLDDVRRMLPPPDAKPRRWWPW
jgi:hypothetical protein